MISTKDARIESIDVWSLDDLAQTDLEWNFQGEHILAYTGEFSLPLSGDQLDYWSEKGTYFFPSTRSTAARNSIDFKIVDWHLENGELSGKFEGRSFQNPINFEEGNKIFRVLAYKEEDQLSESEVRDLSDKIVKSQQYEVKDGLLEIAIDRRLHLEVASPTFDELDENRDQFIKRGEKGFEGGGSLGTFELFESVPVSMPENIYGRILDTTIKGHSYHLQSPCIDPEFEGPVVTEVAFPNRRQPEIPGNWNSKPYLEVELYRASEFRNLRISN